MCVVPASPIKSLKLLQEAAPA